MAGQLILNRYRPVREAGAGGFGTVQVAWDTRIQRKVAIKCIELTDADAARAALPDGAGGQFDPIDILEEAAPADPEFLDVLDEARGTELSPEERWLSNVPGLDEARTAAMLSDPNIVAVYDFEIQDRTAYLIMEYVEGPTLSQLLRDYDDRLTLDMVAAVFADVSHALEVAHANQVLHLDIKPDNILINHQGQVKVTDFGLATLTDAHGTGAAGGGTIGYMPLEQMRQEPLDSRCDEWALASVTYEMLTGKNPFLTSSLSSAEAAIEDAELVLPSLCWEGLDPGIDDVVFYALDPDREERYASVADFAEELEPFLGDVKTGHHELAELVGFVEGGEDPLDAEPIPRVPLGDRLGLRESAVASRVFAGLGTAMFAFVSLANIPQTAGWDNPLFWGLFALITLAGVLKPHLGCLLGCGALAVSLFLNQAYVLGAVLVVAAGLWWFFVGRLGNAPANVAVAVPLLGSFGAAPIAPMAAGYYLTVGRAAATAAFSALLALVMAGFGSENLSGWNALAHWQFAGADVQGVVWKMVAEPATWLIIASWVLAAVVFSLCTARGTRWLAVLGSILACAILLAAVFAAWALAGRSGWMPQTAQLVPAVAAGVLGVFAACVLVPEHEHWVKPSPED